jgi:hypothetical protein
MASVLLNIAILTVFLLNLEKVGTIDRTEWPSALSRGGSEFVDLKSTLT